MTKKIKDTAITKTVDLGNYSRYDTIIMKEANDYSLKLDGTGHTVKVTGEPENINDLVQYLNEYHKANAKIMDSKSFRVKYMDRTFKVKAKDHQDAANKVIKNMKDARPDVNIIRNIEKAANNIRSNNITVAVRTDADKDGVFINEMYISTSGKWLETPQEADEYLRDLSNAIRFFKENYKYLGK